MKAINKQVELPIDFVPVKQVSDTTNSDNDLHYELTVPAMGCYRADMKFDYHNNDF